MTYNRSRGITAACIMFAVAGCTTAMAETQTASCGRVEVLASYPNGTWLENLTRTSEGRLYYSVTTDKRIDIYEPGHGVRRFTELPVYPMGIVRVGDTFVIAGNTRALSDVPARYATNAIVEVDLHGRLLRQVMVPDAKMLNGAVLLNSGTVLVADSLTGKIFEYQPGAAKVSIWLAADLIGPPQGGGPLAVGANGLKLSGRDLLVSVSSKKTIVQIPIEPSGRPAGPPTVRFSPGIVDDFTVAPGGDLYAAPYTTTIDRIGSDGVAVPIIPGGADGATAVTMAGPGAIYALTTGNLLVGGKGPAELLKISLPRGTGACAPAAR